MSLQWSSSRVVHAWCLHAVMLKLQQVLLVPVFALTKNIMWNMQLIGNLLKYACAKNYQKRESSCKNKRVFALRSGLTLHCTCISAVTSIIRSQCVVGVFYWVNFAFRHTLNSLWKFRSQKFSSMCAVLLRTYSLLFVNITTSSDALHWAY